MNYEKIVEENFGEKYKKLKKKVVEQGGQGDGIKEL